MNGVVTLVFLTGLALSGAAEAPASESPKRVEAALEKAFEAGEEGRWSEAERLSRKAREAGPLPGRAAAMHAAALARLGKPEEALAALEDAARGGYDEPHVLRLNEAFTGLRSHLRFAGALRRIDENLARARERVAAAHAPVPASTAPPFDTLGALARAFDEEEKRAFEEVGWEAQQVAHRKARMRRIAALERYVAEHPDAKDRQEAALARLRAWAERPGMLLPWRPGPAADLAREAAAYLAARSGDAGDAQAGGTGDAQTSGGSDALREARFYALSARVLSGLEGDEQRVLVFPTEAACRPALADLTAMAAEPEGGAWAARAAALQAICRHVTHPEDLESLRGAAARWKTAPRDSRGPSGVGFALDGLLTAATLRAFGPPDFALTAHDGTSVSLQALRGKVVLLNFWSPG